MLPKPGAFLLHFSTETFLSHSLAVFHIVKSGGYFSDLIYMPCQQLLVKLITCFLIEIPFSFVFHTTTYSHWLLPLCPLLVLLLFF